MICLLHKGSGLTVSVIVPTFNNAKYIVAAIDSIRKQSHKDTEIIVIDDGSTDNTQQIMKTFPDVVYVYQQHQGPAKARNKGLSEAHGEYIQFLDSDDVLLPTKLEKCLAVFDSHPDVGLVYTDYEVRNSDLKEPIAIQSTIPQKPQGSVLAELINSMSTFFAPHCALIRRSHIDAVNGFNEHLMGTEDWFLWVSLAAQGVGFYHLNEVLAWTRKHDTNLSNNTLNLAYARLHAYEALRQLNISSDIIDVDTMIAGRHHMLGIRLWQVGQRTQAREHILRAIVLDHRGRLSRALLLLLSYFTEADSAVQFQTTLSKLKNQIYRHEDSR